MKKLSVVALALIALLGARIANADTTAPSPLANAVRVAKPAPVKPVTNAVQHLVCKSRVTRPLEQQGAGPRTTVTVCEM